MNVISFWPLIIVALGAGVIIGLSIKKFVETPTPQQLNQIKEWLLFAVAQAEKQFGGGTGQLKLRYVYDKFLTQFPKLAQIISFETFSMLVDEVLKRFKVILAANEYLQAYIGTVVR